MTEMIENRTIEEKVILVGVSTSDEDETRQSVEGTG